MLSLAKNGMPNKAPLSFLANRASAALAAFKAPASSMAKQAFSFLLRRLIAARQSLVSSREEISPLSSRWRASAIVRRFNFILF